MDEPTLSITESMLRPEWFADYFPAPESWVRWMTFLDAFQGLELTPDQMADYEKFTGRTDPPSKPFDTAYVISGRRSGKSRIASVISVWLALASGLHRRLAKGETGWVVVIASKIEQAHIVFSYIKALASHFPKDINHMTNTEVWFTNGTAIKVTAGTWRGVRGATLLGATVDECAFIRSDDESRFVANPAEELLRALRPGIVKGGKLVCISTIRGARGPMYNAWKRHWGTDSRTLVWRSTTADMNPTFDKTIINDEMAEDPENARAEYLSEWLEDLSTLIPSEIVRACMTREEVPALPGLSYVAFCDLSGNKSDSHAFAVCHKVRDRIVLDSFMEILPGQDTVDNVVTQFAALAKAYRCPEISCDSFGAEWASAPFLKAGTPLKKSVMPKSNLYLNAAQLIRSGKVDLIFSERVLNQFAVLDRRPGPQGVDRVEKIPGSHEDLVNAICGALVTAHTENSLSSEEQEAWAKTFLRSSVRAERVMTPALVKQKKLRELELENEQIMDEYMRESGCNRIIRDR